MAISVAKAAARELIDRLADAQPNLESAIEHGMAISFATTRLTVAGLQRRRPGAVGLRGMPDVHWSVRWLFRDQLLSKINAGFDEIADDKMPSTSGSARECWRPSTRTAWLRREPSALIWAAAGAAK